MRRLSFLALLVCSLLAGLAAGCVLQVIGLWRFRGPLRLSAMPGMSSIMRRLSRH